MQIAPSCPLCDSAAVLFCEDPARHYLRCVCCALVFADRRSLPARDTEQRHYECHQNHPRDVQYRRFLNRLFEPMNARLEAGSRGLDFGSGPGPTLSLMFAEAGHPMQIYDPFYAADRSVLHRQYDFITASEVVEHFHWPGNEFARMWPLLHPGGWLAVMTKRVRDRAAFQSWHYKLDPTHVSFFSLATFAWLTDKLQAEMTVVGDDVVLFRKSSKSFTT